MLVVAVRQDIVVRVFEGRCVVTAVARGRRGEFGRARAAVIHRAPAVVATERPDVVNLAGHSTAEQAKRATGEQARPGDATTPFSKLRIIKHRK